MMEPPGGRRWSRSRSTSALDFRRAMRKVDAELGESWWFKVWGPQTLAEEGIGRREDWFLKTATSGTASARLAPGFNMLDPIKRDHHYPGLNLKRFVLPTRNSGLDRDQVPGEHGIIVEKTGLYRSSSCSPSAFTKGRWNTMVTELQQFKDDYEQNQPLWRVMPEFLPRATRPTRTGACAELCDEIHAVYRDNDIGPPDHRDVPVGDWCGEDSRPRPTRRWRTGRSTRAGRRARRTRLGPCWLDAVPGPASRC